MQPTPDRPADGQGYGDRHRRRMAARSREQSAAVEDIGELPPVADPARKEACRLNLERFLVEYFPASTGLNPFSPDHRTVIERIQNKVLSGGKAANVVFRGFAKTTIAENATIWATAYGHVAYALLLAANAAMAQELLDAIKAEWEGNELLYGDFPEVAHAFRALEGKPQRCAAQTYRGQRTHVVWKQDRIVYPLIPGSAAAEVILMARGLTSATRGLAHKRHDGTNVRPQFVLGDDLQTDASAASAAQTRKRLRLLKGAVAKLSGHQHSLAMVLNGTVIQAADMMDQILHHPDFAAFDGVAIPFVKSLSRAHATHWMVSYRELRQHFDRSSPGSAEMASVAATAYYREHRAEMDDGMQVACDWCFDPRSEISACQHAYNMLIDDGEEAFACEAQQKPLPPQQTAYTLNAAALAKRLSGLPRGVAPQTATALTAYVDVHEKVLYWVVSAWGPNLAGGPIDYGTYPPQPVRYFAQNNPIRSMSDAHPGLVEDAWITAGLTAVVDGLLSRRFAREDGGTLAIGKLLVDVKWGEKNRLLKEFCRRHAAYPNVLFPAQGIGLGATSRPLDEYKPEPGAEVGLHWRIPPARGGDRWCTIDANWWKTFAATRLSAPPGTPGAWMLFGRDPAEHCLFVDHCCAERPDEITGRGRTVVVWSQVPGQDNHYWDCLVNTAVAANILKMDPEGMERTPRKRRATKLSDLTARR